VVVDQAGGYSGLVIILVGSGMTIESIVKAVKAGEMTQKEALQKLGEFMKMHKKEASAFNSAVSLILGMPEEPDSIPEEVRNTLQIRDSQ
jgi:hypothetical protein